MQWTLNRFGRERNVPSNSGSSVMGGKNDGFSGMLHYAIKRAIKATYFRRRIRTSPFSDGDSLCQHAAGKLGFDETASYARF